MTSFKNLKVFFFVVVIVVVVIGMQPEQGAGSFRAVCVQALVALKEQRLRA